MRKNYSEIGVTDIRVFDEKQLGLALKYGMTPYCGTFAPRGRHGQVMSPKEEEYFAYINAHDLGKITSTEMEDLKDRRSIEMKHRFGPLK